MSDEKKIIVDEDWKAQAQKEKEELKAKEANEPAEQKEASDQPQERPPLPTPNVPGLVSMLATQAFFAMGLITTEQNKEVAPDLEMAKFNIDMIAVVEEKTKGNLDDEEAKMITDTLQQLRMVFVQVSSGKK